jgi:uncharacterized protein YjbJ (UPF0337 family)
MDNEHVKGAVDIVVGKTKEVVGHVAGKEFEIEGKFDLAKGATHNAIGDAKDASKKTIDSVTSAPGKH